MMHNQWKDTGAITSNPQLSLIFKEVGQYLDHRGISYLEVDVVSWNKEFSNQHNNPYYPKQ